MESRSPGAGSPVASDDRLASAILGATELALFENAYAAYSAEAQRTALGFLADPELALDAVHNAFLEILRRLLNGARWSDPAEARAVVLRNTRWAALNILRTRRRRREAGVAEAAPEMDDGADWARSEARGLCDQIVLQLRPQHQRALWLHFVEGLSNPEAASRLGMATSAYESLLRRAISSARRAARKSGFLPGLLWWPALRPKRTSRPSRHVAHVMLSSTAMVAQGGAVALIVVLAAGAAGLGSEADHPLLTTAHRQTGTTSSTPSLHVGADDEQVDDIVISDAVASIRRRLREQCSPSAAVARARAGSSPAPPTRVATGRSPQAPTPCLRRSTSR
jgi:RNA polymerase sigma factor (sigma-70 family)